MELVGVRLEVPANAPVMMLREQEGQRRLLPIYIGNPEAAAIHYAIEGIVPARPLTHDLLRDVLSVLDAEIERVVVTEMRDHTYFAELHLMQGERAIIVSSRPSDAVAIAVRVGCPIYATDQVLEAGGQVEEAATDGDEPGDEAQILAEFQDFIASVSPDDFAE
jgi:bifunctional DNase/RNase